MIMYGTFLPVLIGITSMYLEFLFRNAANTIVQELFISDTEAYMIRLAASVFVQGKKPLIKNEELRKKAGFMIVFS